MKVNCEMCGIYKEQYKFKKTHSGTELCEDCVGEIREEIARQELENK